MKRSLQDQADDPKLWEVLKHKFEKSSASSGPCRTYTFRGSDHDDHKEDDAPPEGKKRAKRQKKSKSSKSARGSSLKQPAQNEVIPEDDSPELIKEFQNVDKHVYDHERMEAMLRDMMSNQFRNVEEYAYHLEQSTNYMENQIVWESRQDDIRQSEPLFSTNGNSEEKSYILSLHKIHAVPFPEDDLEEKMKRWVKKEFKTFNKEARLSIQHWKDSWHKRLYKINHKRVRANPEEYFSNHKIFEVVKVTIEQQHGLDILEQIIMMRENDKPYSFSEADFKYLNKNDIEDLYYLCQNKKVDYHENKLLNSLMTFIRSLEGSEAKDLETEFWKKPPVLGDLDLDIMKAYEEEITKRLRQREQMRRWESFVNGRPILLTMWCQ
ncbi:hypothetical protein Tco_1233339 [Tanacetum coccineum]